MENIIRVIGEAQGRREVLGEPSVDREERERWNCEGKHYRFTSPHCTLSVSPAVSSIRKVYRAGK